MKLAASCMGSIWQQFYDSTPTSIIVAKLRAYENSHSSRHLDDIASIVRVQGGNLEPEQINIAATRLGLLGVWQTIWEKNRSG